MMKRLIALSLALTLILSLFGCAAEPKEKDAVDEMLEEIIGSEETFVAFDKESAEMNDPLTICMDLEYVRDLNGTKTVEVILNDFLYTLEESGGLSDVEIQYIPKHGADRDAMLQSIQEEIAMGGGPDVFIVNCLGSSAGWHAEEETPLFSYPEQAMHDGLFLPLDEYMENYTRFTDWDKQTEAVLSAGRNWEGQQIIPLTYTLPMICFRKSDVDLDLTDAEYTWNDMLEDPEISRYARLLADCATPEWIPEYGLTLAGDGFTYLEYALGQLADFETGELCFTEEELQQCAEDIRTLYGELEFASSSFEKGSQGELDYFCTWLGWDMVSPESDVIHNLRHNDPLTMIPLYSDDGGVTASILSWAAVNRNTDRPEDAYTVIDMLMRDHVQRNYWIYEEMLCAFTKGIPMHEGLLHPDMPFGRGLNWSLTEENYNEWCEVRSQIVGANFQSKLGMELSKLPLTYTGEAEFAIYGYEKTFQTTVEATHSIYERMEQMMLERDF